MELAKQLFFNLSLLLVIQFFFQVWVDRHENQKVSRSITNIYMLLSVLVSISMSVPTSSHVRLDMRQVPLIVGGLYGSPLDSIYLYVSTLVIRAFFGIDKGFWATCISFGILAMVIVAVRWRFTSLSLKNKTLVSVLISIFSSVILLVTLALMDTSFDTFMILINYIAVPALGTGVMTYTIESWIKKRYLHRQVIKSEKIEIVSHLGASIAHEIRNPLTTVHGFLQLIKMNEINEQKRMEFVDIALKEIEETESIISDFLTFTKPSINKIEELDACKEIQQVVNMIKPLANMNCIQLETKFTSLGTIYADKTLFQQCLVNLCKNSLEAMEDGGVLRITTKERRGKFLIEVADTGMGLTEEQIKHHGEPYFLTSGQKGTGLGVMVVYSIVEALKGSIDVSSEKGEGTTVTLSFPLEGKQKMAHLQN